MRYIAICSPGSHVTPILHLDTTMHAHHLQHVPFEGLGNIETWLQDTGYTITRTRFYASEQLPALNDIDLLVVMGGPMSVNDEQEYPWIVDEKKFIRDFIESGKPVLGICLGAQLIASAMGADVFQNPVKEMGWFPVHSVPSSSQAIIKFPEEITAFHWHGETFNLPPNAVHIAKSEACKNQAFQLGNCVIGIQFHLETTEDSAYQIIANCRNELVVGPYIQSEPEILSASDERYSTINLLMNDILEFLHNSG